MIRGEGGKAVILVPAVPIIFFSIREIYATMLRLAANLGYPRRVGETPYDYLPTLLAVKSKTLVDRKTEL